MTELALVEVHGATTVISDHGTALAYDHAFAPGAGHKVIRLDECRDVAVFHHRHRHVVEAAPEIVALDGACASRRVVEQIREQIEVMDGIGVRHADVHPRALESGKPASGKT